MPLEKVITTVAGSPAFRLPSSRRKIFCPGNTLVVCVRLADRRVEDAWSSGRMMRNMNLLLQDARDDNGRPCFVRRAQSLCNDGHALAAVRALEDLAGITPPRNAVLVRSLVQSLRTVQAHLLHFYQFHLSNWVCLDSALMADPCKTARLADRADRKPGYFRQSQQRLHPLAQSSGRRRAGNEVCGHPEFAGPEEFHLLVHSHSLESLQIQGAINTALGLLGCGNGIYAAYQAGGLPQDLNLGSEVLQQLRGLLQQCRDFVCRTFLPDLEQVARTYRHWQTLAPCEAFLCLGDFVRPHGSGQLFPQGIIRPAGKACQKSGPIEMQIDPVQTGPVGSGLLREESSPQWEPLDKMHYRLNFGKHGPLFYWPKGGFQRLSAPRHGKEACEVGALSRVMGAWGQGAPEVCAVVNKSLDVCGLLPEALNSALGRFLSRGIEAWVLARAGLAWLDELQESPVGQHDRIRSDLCWPDSGVGTGRAEVPRGALTHTIRLEKNKIISHDYLIPSLWNFSPRDSDGRRGPLEQALVDTQVCDPDRPLEVLRIVNAFDPCHPCHLVVEDSDTGRISVVEAG